MSRTINLLALFCTVPSAFLAFKARFTENYKFQCEQILKKENPNYIKDVRWDYRFVAFLFFKVTHRNWKDIFSNESDIVRRMQFDRSDAVRGLWWFTVFFVLVLFSLLLFP